MSSARPLASYLLVFAQLVAVVASCLPIAPEQSRGYLAMALIVAGITLGVITLGFNRIGNFSVYPEPKAAGRLITTGPYRRIRHPMYAALALMMLGVSLYNGHFINVVAWVLLLVVLAGKIHREERYLLERFAEYRAYVERTARVVPGVW